MGSLELIYVGFGIIIFAIIGVYFFSGTNEKKGNNFKESLIWILGGVSYAFMLGDMFVNPELTLYIFYLYLLLTTLVFMVMLNVNIKNQSIIPIRFYISLEAFMTLWVIFSIQQKLSYFNTVLPIILIQSMALFFIGLIYLLHEEYEMSMRNISGMLFLVMAMIKLMYLIKVRIIMEEYIRGIFRLDFTVYLFIAFVIVLFDYNKNSMKPLSKEKRMMESLRHLSVGFIQLNFRGDVIGGNDFCLSWFQHLMDKNGVEEVLSIYQLIKFPNENDFDRVMNLITEGETYSVLADIESHETAGRFEFLFMLNNSSLNDNNQSTLVNCFMLDAHREIMALEEFSPDLIENVDVHTEIPNRYKLNELLDIGINTKGMFHFGVILIKIVNYIDITAILNLNETFAIDFLVTKRFKKLEFVYCIGKVTEDTYEIITNDYADQEEIIRCIQYIQDILTHQNFYDNDMNVYTLDYRIGVAFAPADGFSQRELMSNAFVAIAKASTEERGYVQFYYDGLTHELESKFCNGMLTDHLFLAYHPQRDDVSETIGGFNIVIKCKLPNSIVISSNEFMPVAEENNMLGELNKWLFRSSLQQTLTWSKSFCMDLYVCIQLSVLQLEERDFAKCIFQTLIELDYNPQFLKLDVTEIGLTQSPDRILKELKKLQLEGIKISVNNSEPLTKSIEINSYFVFDTYLEEKGFKDSKLFSEDEIFELLKESR